MASAEMDKLGADLSAYLDGELSPERAREIEQLLGESEQARRMLDDLCAVSTGLAALPRRTAPTNLTDTLRRQIEHPPSTARVQSPRQGRILRLFARLTASAALIAIGAVAGWLAFERMGPAPQIAAVTEIAPDAAREPKGTTAEPLAHRGVTNLERYEAADKLATTASPRAKIAATPATEAPVIAMAEESQTEFFDAADDLPRAAQYHPNKKAAAGVELGEGYAAARSLYSADTSSTVGVTVTPNTRTDFNNALATVVRWQATQTPMAAPQAADEITTHSYGIYDEAQPTMAGRAGGGPTPERLDFIIQAPPDQVNELLQSLEQQTPSQVQVAMRFNQRDIAQVQRIVMPPPAPDTGGFAKHPADSPSPAKRVSPETPAAQPPTDGVAIAAREKSADETNAGQVKRHAGGRGRARGGRGGGIAEKPEDSSKREAKAGLAEEERHALQSLGYIAAEPESDIDASKAPASQPAVPEGALIRGMREYSADVRSQLGQMVQVMLDAANQAQQAPPTPPVTLHVTLLPPPETPHPTSNPIPQP